MSGHTPGVQSLRQGQGQAARHTRRDPHHQGGGGGPEGGEHLQPHRGHPAQLGREGAHSHTLVPDIAMDYTCRIRQMSESPRACWEHLCGEQVDDGEGCAGPGLAQEGEAEPSEGQVQGEQRPGHAGQAGHNLAIMTVM